MGAGRVQETPGEGDIEERANLGGEGIARRAGGTQLDERVRRLLRVSVCDRLPRQVLPRMAEVGALLEQVIERRYGFPRGLADKRATVQQLVGEEEPPEEQLP